jgi:Sulfotransferase domain
MALQVVGAGVGRTGTHSLKLALEQLLEGPCYHMVDVFARSDDIAAWERAAHGDLPEWDTFFEGYRATVDWPAAAFWPELHVAFPRALVLLSVRDTEGWWRSAERTVFAFGQLPSDAPPAVVAQLQMATALLRARFGDVNDEDAAKAAYERHNAEVRTAVPPDQLLEWHLGDGWEPICAALGLAVPDDPFPHVNTTDDFRAMVGLEGP